MDGSHPVLMTEKVNHPLLFEMLRSFTTLARTLNLSQAVRELGSTRQTVRRHISQLEEAVGHPLFIVRDRSYELTADGARVISAAEDILARGGLLVSGGLKDIEGMPLLSVRNEKGWEFHQQQLSLSKVWDGKSHLLKSALKAWTRAEGKLDAPEMDEIRQYILVYRDLDQDWLCVEIGEHSFYAKWWGWKNARSSIGRALNKFPGGEEVAALMDAPYREVLRNRSVRLDQVATTVPREPGGPIVPNVFDRLLMGAQFPDGSFALIVVVDRAHNLEIAGLDDTLLERMPTDVEIDFVIS